MVKIVNMPSDEMIESIIEDGRKGRAENLDLNQYLVDIFCGYIQEERVYEIKDRR